MDIFHAPENLEIVTHFDVPQVQAWGDSKKDVPYKELVRQCANLPPSARTEFAWFVFVIRCVVSERRRSRLGPDVENIPKSIVDAFTGTLYPDDNLDYVRGVQVEAIFGSAEQEHAEIWIYGSH